MSVSGSHETITKLFVFVPEPGSKVEEEQEEGNPQNPHCVDYSRYSFEHLQFYAFWLRGCEHNDSINGRNAVVYDAHQIHCQCVKSETDFSTGADLVDAVIDNP